MSDTTQVSDRELLELAAKAAGPTIYDAGGVYMRELARGYVTGWNPLKDDGDALRLAVRLRIDIHLDGNLVEVVAAAGGRDIHETVPYFDDDEAATRRAIVRAAAEIGRSDRKE
jgi:hypothetical protein